MPNLILIDSPSTWQNLLPITFTRPISELRIGILTISEKWKRYLKINQIYYKTEDYLQEKFPCILSEDNLIIYSHFLPDKNSVQKIKKLKQNECLVQKKELIAIRCTKEDAKNILKHKPTSTLFKTIDYDTDLIQINHPWDLFIHNGKEIRKDFALITHQKKSHRIKDKHTVLYNPKHIFIEEGVQVKAAILNAEEGPIFIGKNSSIQEGAIIKGPFCLNEGGVINMGAKMREDTTIGPYSKVGGEISNSIILGYSNKAHDGFLGNSIIGEWCNLGADTNTSNLKNNYSHIKAWSYPHEDFQDTQRQFLGLIMGDHSKSGINTMFNTGTSVGIAANIFGGDFPPKFIPSFYWGGVMMQDVFEIKKAFEAAEKMMGRRGKNLTQQDKKIIAHIFNITQKDRTKK